MYICLNHVDLTFVVNILYFLISTAGVREKTFPFWHASRLGGEPQRNRECVHI